MLFLGDGGVPRFILFVLWVRCFLDSYRGGCNFRRISQVSAGGGGGGGVGVGSLLCI